MEYISIWNIAYFKTKQCYIIHKTYFPYFVIWKISEYGIFWKMEYFEIWNILEYGIFSKWNMAYFETKHYSITHKTYFYILEYGVFWNMEYFGKWNMKYFGICKILANGIRHIFENLRNVIITIRKIMFSRRTFYLTKTCLPYFGIWNISEYS